MRTRPSATPNPLLLVAPTIGLLVPMLAVLALTLFPEGLHAGYRAHYNDRDMAAFLRAYPACKGSRIDTCLLCHPAGEVAGKHGDRRFVDACTHCHDVYGLTPPHGPVPLNAYGRAWLAAGRDVAAFRRIALADPDGDGAANWKEIARDSFPGDGSDHPGLRRPPSRKFGPQDLARLPVTRFTLLMNTHKSGDFYATYEGVAVEDLLRHVGLAPEARAATFFCPDGYRFTVNLRGDEGYHVLGAYPQGRLHTGLPWVEIPPEIAALGEGHALPGTPRALLAMRRNGRPLGVSRLVRKSPESRRWVLSDEGPYRLVLPQARPCPPDQPSNRAYPGHPHPFDEKADHNGGPSVRSVVAIRVDPLPEGCTDADWHRRGWKLVDEGSLVVYGAIAPRR